MDEQGRVVNNTKVGALPDGVVEAEGFLWVANTTDGEVTRIDAADLRPDGQRSRSAPARRAIAAGFGAIWVANSGDRTVSRINASTGDVVSKLTVGMAPYGIVADDRWVWVTNMLDGTLSRIDPVTEAVDTFPVGRAPLGVTSAAGDDLGRRLRGGRCRARRSEHGGRRRPHPRRQRTDIDRDGRRPALGRRHATTAPSPASIRRRARSRRSSNSVVTPVRSLSSGRCGLGRGSVAAGHGPGRSGVGRRHRFPLEGSPQSVWLAAVAP